MRLTHSMRAKGANLMRHDHRRTAEAGSVRSKDSMSTWTSSALVVGRPSVRRGPAINRRDCCRAEARPSGGANHCGAGGYLDPRHSNERPTWRQHKAHLSLSDGSGPAPSAETGIIRR